MISKTMRAILHALSYSNVEVEAARRLADLKKLDAMRIFVKKLEHYFDLVRHESQGNVHIFYLSSILQLILK